MNYKKEFILCFIMLAIVEITGCSTNKSLKTPFERALNHSAQSEAIETKLTYSYGTGAEKRFHTKYYAFYKNSNFQTAVLNESVVQFYTYKHENQYYRIYEHQNQYFYEEAHTYFNGSWDLNNAFLELLSKQTDFIKDDSESIYKITISGDELVTDYSIIDTLIKDFAGTDIKEQVDLSEIGVDILIKFNPETEQLVSMEIECESYISSVYHYGVFVDNLLVLEFSYDLDPHPIVDFEDMIEDDAARHPSLKQHTLFIGEVAETNLQYIGDEDIIKFTIENDNTFLKFESSGIYASYFVWVQTPFGYVESYSITNGSVNGFNQGDYYISVHQLNLAGIAKIKLTVA